MQMIALFPPLSLHQAIASKPAISSPHRFVLNISLTVMNPNGMMMNPNGMMMNPNSTSL